MSRFRRLVTLPTILLALIGVGGLFNMTVRYQGALVVAEVTNEANHAWPVRIHDGWSGRDLGTWEVDAGATVLLIDDRLDEWWVGEPQVTDEPRRHKFVVDVLGPEGCELVSTIGIRDGRDTLVLTSSGQIADRGNADGQPARSSTAQRPTPITDPCDGRPAPPRGLVINTTTRPIVLGPGVVVAACASRIFHPGDLVGPDAVIPVDAVRVAVPTIDVQDERWPLEPRSVVVGAGHIDESTEPPNDPGAIGCYGEPSPKTEAAS